MKNVIFEKLKAEYNFEMHETLKLYCDTIWDVYEENDLNEFKDTIEIFIKKFDKAYTLYQEGKVINFTDYSINNVLLEKIVRNTNWSNITDVIDYKFRIIDSNEIYSYQMHYENKNEVYILEDLELFKSIYSFFCINIL